MDRLLKAIVVEDDPVLCKLFAETLEQDENITTSQAHTLGEAIAICRKERQVVLIVDLTIPGATGMQAVTGLRREAPGATIVVITGGDDATMQAARRAGAHEVIAKGSPESIDGGLIKTVRNAVVAHDIELMFAGATETVEAIRRTVSQATDGSGTYPKIDKHSSDPLNPTGRISVDSNGIICGINVGVSQIAGWLPDDLIGKPLVFVVPERYRTQHRRKFEMAARSPTFVSREDLPLEMLKKDGTEVAVWISVDKMVTNNAVMFHGAIKLRNPPATGG